jgi:tRNA threonylcarbamoyladenosine biosynthesis protein TsaB
MILHLETATKVCSVALSSNGKLLQLSEIDNDAFAHGEQLTVLIEKVIEQESITMQELTAVSVASGPGSYTGLRIGVATAKGLCYALNIPLIAVDALSSLAEMARLKFPGSVLCPMIDARRMEVFSAHFSPDGNFLKPISADVLDENSYSEYEPFVYFGDGAEKMKEIWKERNIQFADVKCSAEGQVRLATEKYNQQQFEDVAYFEPFYLKEFYMPTKK